MLFKSFKPYRVIMSIFVRNRSAGFQGLVIKEIKSSWISRQKEF